VHAELDLAARTEYGGDESGPVLVRDPRLLLEGLLNLDHGLPSGALVITIGVTAQTGFLDSWMKKVLDGFRHISPLGPTLA